MLAWPPTSWPSRSWPLASWPDDGRHHRILSRPTRTPGSGTDTIIGVVLPGDAAELVITGTPSSEQFVYVVAYNRRGKPAPAPGSPALRRVAFDASGALILPVPNAPTGLQLEAGAGGTVTAAWTYLSFGEETPAASFNVYVATGEDAFDYDAPAHQVAASGGGRRLTQDLGAFADGATVRVVVRSVGAAGVGAEEANTDEQTILADAAPPDAPTALTTEVTDE